MSTHTASPTSPPRPVLTAIACIWGVVALGIAAVVFILTLYFDTYRSEIVPLIVGETITVILPAVLTVFIARAANWAWISYYLLSAIGVALRLAGLADSLSGGPGVISALQAGSILLTLIAVALLLSPTARKYLRSTQPAR
jgi:hypothetical protein